jgi:hypothetical protein
VYPQTTEDGDVRIDIGDAELRKQLSLTTADLRFSETVVHTVLGNSTGDSFMEETGNYGN